MSEKLTAAEIKEILAGKRSLPPRRMTQAERTMAEARRDTFTERPRRAADRYNTAQRGRRADLGNIYFDSRANANYARYLEWLRQRGEIDAWEFEPERFVFEKILTGTRVYTPDFKVWPALESPYFVEVKPWMDPKSKTKLKRMAKYFPDVRVVVVGREELRELDRKLGKTIPGWENSTS
jgi:hypothetical protein